MTECTHLHLMHHQASVNSCNNSISTDHVLLKGNVNAKSVSSTDWGILVCFVL